MKQNRQCLCCDTKYSYCPSCNNADKMKPSWYSQFCSETCKTLWETATKFNMKLISKEDAANILNSLELKNKEEYVECVQRDITNIFKKEAKKYEYRKKPVVVEPQEEKIPEEVKEEEHEVVITE